MIRPFPSEPFSGESCRPDTKKRRIDSRAQRESSPRICARRCHRLFLKSSHRDFTPFPWSKVFQIFESSMRCRHVRAFETGHEQNRLIRRRLGSSTIKAVPGPLSPGLGIKASAWRWNSTCDKSNRPMGRASASEFPSWVLFFLFCFPFINPHRALPLTPVSSTGRTLPSPPGLGERFTRLRRRQSPTRHSRFGDGARRPGVGVKGLLGVNTNMGRLISTLELGRGLPPSGAGRSLLSLPSASRPAIH